MGASVTKIILIKEEALFLPSLKSEGGHNVSLDGSKS